ncbi:uncharacterized protein A4U43_C10F2350 [Asparagus officinalis]|uniref:Uncharacterized protein n=1 Tax=Asparagus officinalis TaxID=4686 RepID=A0A5P1E030_ASPOF|nr:uncharacterized protein A4U43_C10F2350 [Asparagus officinalis]
MREGGLEDIREFFSSGEYVPGKILDDKKPKGTRKLFTQEEKTLLNKRIPNLGEATSSKWLPLHTLAASGEFYLLDALLKHNVDINAVDKDGLSAMHKAIFCKKQAIINYLLRNSANPHIRDKDGATLIHYAVQTASSQTIKILLLYDVDINLADNDGWTPLHLAVQAKRTDIVRLLLIKGADRTLKNGGGLTPLDLCLYSGHDVRTFELIKLLKGLSMSKKVKYIFSSRFGSIFPSVLVAFLALKLILLSKLQKSSWILYENPSNLKARINTPPPPRISRSDRSSDDHREAAVKIDGDSQSPSTRSMLTTATTSGEDKLRFL